MNTRSLIRPLIATLVSGGAFIAIEGLQEATLATVDVGVSAPYLPAGVRLVAAAVFGLSGCMGVFLGSLWVAAEMFPVASPASLLVIAAISGFVPLLALGIVRRAFGIGEQLRELSFRLLLVLIALMSVISPAAHQLVFLLTGIAPANLYNLLAMIAGDMVGCMLLVLALAVIWGWVERR